MCCGTHYSAATILNRGVLPGASAIHGYLPIQRGGSGVLCLITAAALEEPRRSHPFDLDAQQTFEYRNAGRNHKMLRQTPDMQASLVGSLSGFAHGIDDSCNIERYIYNPSHFYMEVLSTLQ